MRAFLGVQGVPSTCQVGTQLSINWLNTSYAGVVRSQVCTHSIVVYNAADSIEYRFIPT